MVRSRSHQAGGWLTAAMVAALAVAGCHSGGSSYTETATTAAPPPSTTTAGPIRPIILIAHHIRWSATSLRVRTGQRVAVRVVNQDGVEHNFTFPAAHVSKDVEDGKTITVTFTAPAAGTYEFHCEDHPQAMRGTITVT